MTGRRRMLATVTVTVTVTVGVTALGATTARAGLAKGSVRFAYSAFARAGNRSARST